MKPRPRIWFLVSLLLFGGAAYVWRLGEIKRLAPATIPRRIVPATLPSTVVTAPLTTNQAADKHKGPYRLSNTPQSLRQLARNEHGILLRNALIDTARPVHLDIPEHLRSHGAPGS